jgi:hypothetical protein
MNPPVSSVRLDITTSLFPDLAPAHDLWDRIRGGRTLPARADFDPQQVPCDLLPRIMLVDVLKDPLDFRYRLWGTALRDLHGRELTGHSVRDLQPEPYAELMWQQYVEIVETAAPGLYINHVPGQSKTLHRHAVLRLPFSADGTAVDIVMSVDHYGKDEDDLKKFFEEVQTQPLAAQPA